MSPAQSCQVLSLSDADCARLRRFGPMFDVTVSGSPETGMALSSPAISTPVHFSDWRRGHLRLLAEVCARCLRWVRFSTQESCAETLFQLPDAQLARIGELYRLRHDTQRDANVRAAETG